MIENFLKKFFLTTCANLMFWGLITIHAQSISTGNIVGNSFCSGSYVSVPFTITGSFNAGNIFTAQLSNAAGSFASPVSIGILVGTGGGTIDAIIPAGTVSGNGFKMRVTGSNPAVNGSTSASTLTVVHFPETTFQKTYSTGSNTSILSGKVIQLADSSFVFTSFGMNLFKTDAGGNFIWTKKMYESHYYGYQAGGGYSDYADDVRQTADKGFIVGGHKIYADNMGSNQYRIYLVKTDSFGNYIWANTYGDPNTGGCSGSTGTFLNTIKQTADGGYVMTGYTTDFGFGCPGRDIIIKIDSIGNHVWTRTLDDIEVNYVYGWGAADIVEITGGGGDLMIYAANYPYPNPPAFGALIRIHSDGTIVWARKFSIGFNILSTRIVETPGGYYLGSTNGYGLIKVDLNGNVLWAKTFAGDYESSIAATSDSGCILTGYAYTGSPENARLIKVSANGTMQWARDYGSGASIEGQTVAQTLDGGYVMGGNVAGTMYLVKTDSLGNSGGNQSTPSLNTNNIPAADSAYTPVFTSRTTTLLPACTAISDVTTAVNTIVGAGGNCNGYEIAFSGNSCTALANFSADRASICAGDTVSFTDESSNSPVLWKWTFTGGTPDTSTAQNPKVVYNLPGTYNVKLVAYNSSGIDSLIKISYITVYAASGSGTISGPNAVCTGGNIQLSDSGSSGPIQWQSSLDGISFTNIAGDTSPVNNITGFTQTTYYRVNAVGGCGIDSSAAYKVVVSPSVYAGVVTGPNSVCSGSSVQLSDTGTRGGIQWQSSMGGVTFVNIPGDTSVFNDIVNLSQTTYYRVSANGVCGTDSSAPFMLLVNPLPIPVASAADSLICSSDSTQICVSDTFVSYQWNTFDDTSSCTIAKSAGGYWVTVTDANGCSAVSNHQGISVFPVPSVSINVKGDTLTSTNATSYQWLLNDTVIAGATDSVYVAHQTGNYAVQAIDSNGCIATSTNTPIVVSGIAAIGNSGPLNIYPDPFGNTIFIKEENAVSIIEGVDLYNVLGEKVFSERYNSEASGPLAINVSVLVQGPYYILVKTSKANYLKLIIKE